MWKKILIFAIALGFGCAVSQVVIAGDEDKKEEAAAAAPKEPNPDVPAAETPAAEPETSPDMSLGEDKGPEFSETAAPVVDKKTKKKANTQRKDLDMNVDYSEVMGRVDPLSLPKGVLPPALGFRGYRPNMLALGISDRTPGVGGIVEYSFNRIGVGVYLSARKVPDVNTGSKTQSFFGAYGLYRWLPFDTSPYILMGLESAQQTEEDTGGIAGAGVETRVYDGWTVLLGYTYHSTVHKGFFGGSLGWSF